MKPAKVIVMPEGPFVGALERAVEALEGDVLRALQSGEQARDPRAVAEEAIGELRRERERLAQAAGGLMGRGIGERPERSLSVHLEGVEYPADREDLVQAAADNEAPTEIINFFKSLPRERYDSEELVLRDVAEAARRFGLGGHTPAVGSIDRRNLGRDAVEENIDGNPKHP